MICLNCKNAADKNKLSLDIALAEQFQDQLRLEAENLHAMCDKNSCFCQHRMGDENVYKKHR